jgi:hypothetical protein
MKLESMITKSDGRAREGESQGPHGSKSEDESERR